MKTRTLTSNVLSQDKSIQIFFARFKNIPYLLGEHFIKGEIHEKTSCLDN